MTTTQRDALLNSGFNQRDIEDIERIWEFALQDAKDNLLFKKFDNEDVSDILLILAGIPKESS